jgi:hypothetical protein
MITLKQAIKEGKLDQFAAENELEDPHPEGAERFLALLALMTGTQASAGTSDVVVCEGSDETQTPSDT